MREGSPLHTCHVSGDTCHVSHVTCHMSPSHVMCHIFIYLFIFGQSGEASQGRVCYQRGLPRLVFKRVKYFTLKPLSPSLKMLKH